MVFRLIWAERAQEAIEEIKNYVAKDNPRAAKKLIAEIRGRCQALRRFPYLGSLYEDDPSGLTRQFVYKSYRIFYQVHERARRVEIILIWHSSRQEPNLGFPIEE